MKLLVTGAAGFIGFHTAKALLDRGDTVIGLDNLNPYYDVSLKEARLAEGEGFESVVLFALDQLCLIGYSLPLSRRLGSFARRQTGCGARLQYLGRLSRRRLWRRLPDNLRQWLSFQEQLDLARIEDLADQQGFRDSYQDLTMRCENFPGLLVGGIYKPLHFLVDFDSGVLAEVARSCQITPQEDFLLVLSVREGTEV